ncbi:MAG TPA: HNH endonuclease signature motif containing protein [Pirellulales bacterium]|jgi:hypothetical protein
MDRDSRATVRARAHDACEDCRLPQSSAELVRFHVDHILARQHGGTSDLQNLALACSYCNFHKGPNIAGIDPEDGSLVPLYHPRRDQWHEHFNWQGTKIVGTTNVGRATVELLAMNAWQRIELRDNLRAAGASFAV